MKCNRHISDLNTQTFYALWMNIRGQIFFWSLSPQSHLLSEKSGPLQVVMKRLTLKCDNKGQTEMQVCRSADLIANAELAGKLQPGFSMPQAKYARLQFVFTDKAAQDIVVCELTYIMFFILFAVNLIFNQGGGQLVSKY